MATPSLVQNPTTHNFIGSQASYNVLKPTIDEKEWAGFGEENLTGLLEMGGGKNPVRSLQYRHFESARLHSTVRATGTTGGANVSVVYTVDSAYTMASFPATYSPYVLASSGSAAPNASGTTTLHPVRVGDTIMFPDGTQGTCTARNTTTFTVRPDILGDSLPTVVNTEDIVILGVSVGEGSDVPEALNSRNDVYDNVLQIMSDSTKVTGSAMGERLWIKTDYNGKTGYVWTFKNLKDNLRRFKNNRELNMIVGKKVTNTTASHGTGTYDATLLKTEGLYTFAASYNGETNYTIASGLSLADFETMVIDSLDANKGEKENTLMASIKVRQAIDGFIRPEMQAGAVQYNSFKGGKEQAVNFGFNGFLTLGYSFFLKTYDVLNDRTTIGAVESYANSALVLPMGKTSVMTDAGNKGDSGYFRMNYMETESGSREMEEWMTGGTGGVYTNTLDNQVVGYRSHFGFEGFCPNKFNILQGI